MNMGPLKNNVEACTPLWIGSVVVPCEVVKLAFHHTPKLRPLKRRQVPGAEVKGQPLIMQRECRVLPVEGTGYDARLAECRKAIDNLDPSREHNRLQSIQNYVRLAGGLAGFEFVFE